MVRPHQPARRRRRVLGHTALAAAALAGGLALSAGSAEASPRTSSSVIASSADTAVASFERWQETQSPIDYIRFVQERDHAAEVAERDLGLPIGVMQAAWERADLDKQEAVLHALSQLGVPYRSHTSQPGVGFDCSGLTLWAFGEAGLELPRVSRDQIRSADDIELADAEPGDLVYYPGHISIYLGAEMMVHAPYSGRTVEITDLPSRSLRFGDAATALRPAEVTPGSLMDRALAISQ